MLTNYLKIAYRNLLSQKMYAGLNILGLATGMMSLILVILYVTDELSYDSYHKNANRIVRMIHCATPSEKELDIALAGYTYGPTAKEEVPEILNYTRFKKDGRNVKKGDKHFRELDFFYVDASVFEVFDFPLAKGDASSALEGNNKVVLTQAMAQKYFGDANPVGQTLLIDNKDYYEVTGVLAPIPQNTHLKFDFLASIETLLSAKPALRNEWWAPWNYTYLLLQDEQSVETVRAKLSPLAEKYLPTYVEDIKLRFDIQPLTAIHFDKEMIADAAIHSDITYVYVFSSIGLVVLLIAGINFINLATARSARRAKEIGLRKVIGAVRQQLIKQFLAESLFTSFLAMIITVLMLLLILPWFNEIAGKAFALKDLMGMNIILSMLGTFFSIGLIAGIYPAMYLSSFRPSQIMKGVQKHGGQAYWMRKVLVVFQFTMSILLIIGAITAYQQLNFMKNKDVGYSTDNILILPYNNEIKTRYKRETLEREFLQIPEIKGLTLVDNVPASGRITRGVFKTEHIDNTGAMAIYETDPDFVEVMGLDIVAGRDFTFEIAKDTTARHYLINETAAKLLGWSNEEAIGKPFKSSSADFEGLGEIIGVVKDFHFASLHETIEPAVIRYHLGDTRLLALKVSMENINQTISALQNKWQELAPEMPFKYDFLKDEYLQLYKASEKLGNVISVFSILSILIAGLGLIGLAAFTAQQRLKELGIRKVLGASPSSLLLLLSGNLTKLIIISIAIAIPLGNFLMQEWLNSFAYRIDVSWSNYLVAGFSALFLTFVIVCYQSFKAITANPTTTLRNE